jgi:hypothetical protein
MTQSAYAQNGNGLVGAGAAVAQGIERRDAGTDQRPGLDRRKPLGQECKRAWKRDHVLGVAAVVCQTGDAP